VREPILVEPLALRIDPEDEVVATVPEAENLGFLPLGQSPKLAHWSQKADHSFVDRFDRQGWLDHVRHFERSRNISPAPLDRRYDNGTASTKPCRVPSVALVVLALWPEALFEH